MECSTLNGWTGTPQLKRYEAISTWPFCCAMKRAEVRSVEDNLWLPNSSWIFWSSPLSLAAAFSALDSGDGCCAKYEGSKTLGGGLTATKLEISTVSILLLTHSSWLSNLILMYGVSRYGTTVRGVITIVVRSQPNSINHGTVYPSMIYTSKAFFSLRAISSHRKAVTSKYVVRWHRAVVYLAVEWIYVWRV